MNTFTSDQSICPECGATINDVDEPVHAYLPAPAGCWMKFNEALAKEYSDSEYWKSHRCTVDAYCAQHASGNDRRQLHRSRSIWLLCISTSKSITVTRRLHNAWIH